MITFTDDEIDLFAQTILAGYFSDNPGNPSADWAELSQLQRGNWRRAARALIRHLYHGQPVNKAPHHMSEEETDLIRLCDEYEALQGEHGFHAPRAAETAYKLAEHFALIRRAIHRAPTLPAEPTAAMLDAGAMEIAMNRQRVQTGEDGARRVYLAMVAAA